MPRSRTILALLQTLMVLIGFLALGIVLKLEGYPDTMFTGPFSPLAVFLREHWFLLLLVPAAWTAFTVAAERIDRGLFSARPAFIVGVCLAVMIIVLFLYAAVHPLPCFGTPQARRFFFCAPF